MPPFEPSSVEGLLYAAIAALTGTIGALVGAIVWLTVKLLDSKSAEAAMAASVQETIKAWEVAKEWREQERETAHFALRVMDDTNKNAVHSTAALRAIAVEMQRIGGRPPIMGK